MTTLLYVPLVTERTDFAPNFGAPSTRAAQRMTSRRQTRTGGRHRTVGRIFLVIALTVEAEA